MKNDLWRDNAFLMKLRIKPQPINVLDSFDSFHLYEADVPEGPL